VWARYSIRDSNYSYLDATDIYFHITDFNKPHEGCTVKLFNVYQITSDPGLTEVASSRTHNAQRVATVTSLVVYISMFYIRRNNVYLSLFR
jgi:hypothetical protein